MTRRGRPPEFTGSGSESKREDRMRPWVFGGDVPGDEVIGRMISKAIGCMIQATMKMHDYKFDGKMYRQREGGAIGMDLTGVIADVYMCFWDREFVRMIGEENMDCIMYKRYKDDVNVVVRESDDARYENRLTMRKLKEIAERIDEKLTVKTGGCLYWT